MRYAKTEKGREVNIRASIKYRQTPVGKENHRKITARQRARREAEGKCIRCGGNLHDGLKHCENCLKYMRDYKRASKMTNNLSFWELLHMVRTWQRGGIKQDIIRDFLKLYRRVLNNRERR